MIQLVCKTLSSLLSGSEFENCTYLVGGCVRDYMMGVEPNDFDIVVEMPQGGIKLAKYLLENYPSRCKSYAEFPTYGTCKLSLEINGVYIDLEMVETRQETYLNKDSRNPSCSFGSIYADCARRDLTINALYMQINSGVVLDLTDCGIKDIRNNILSTPCDPNSTYSDDPLRMLRCIRFASRYNWEIEKETLEAIKNNAEKILIVSKERIATEISKILVENNVRLGLELLRSTTLLEKIIPELYQTIGLEQNDYHYTDVWGHTLDVVEKTPRNLICRLSALFHDIGKINTRNIDEKGDVHFYNHETESARLLKEILIKYKTPNSIIKSVVLIVANHMRTKSYTDNVTVSDKTLRKLKCDMGVLLEPFLYVVDADNSSHSIKGCMPNQVNNIRQRFLELSEQYSDIDKVNIPINGNDVLDTLKIAPGPIVRVYLDLVIDAYMENPSITRDECIELVYNYHFKNEKI